MRNSARALVVASGATAALMASAPAFADSANDPGPALTVSETLGIFVGIPALVIGLTYAIVYAVAGRNQPRYRQGAGWTAPPQWWNGPTGPAADVPAVAAAPAAAADPVATGSGGGARAQW